MTDPGPLDGPLPEGIRSRFVHNNNGLRVHTLEAGFEAETGLVSSSFTGFRNSPTAGGRSWRRSRPLGSMSSPPISEAMAAPPDGIDGDLASFRFLNLVKDVLGLVFDLGHRSIHSVVGHDFGSPVAAYPERIRHLPPIKVYNQSALLVIDPVKFGLFS